MLRSAALAAFGVAAGVNVAKLGVEFVADTPDYLRRYIARTYKVKLGVLEEQLRDQRYATWGEF